MLIDNKLLDTLRAQCVSHILLDDPCRRAARIGGGQCDIEHIAGISYVADNSQIDERDYWDLRVGHLVQPLPHGLCIRMRYHVAPG